MRVLISHLCSDIAATRISILVEELRTSVITSQIGDLLLMSTLPQCILNIIYVFSVPLQVIIVNILWIIVILSSSNYSLVFFLLLLLLFLVLLFRWGWMYNDITIGMLIDLYDCLLILLRGVLMSIIWGYISISIVKSMFLLSWLISTSTHLGHGRHFLNSHLHNLAQTVRIESVLIIIWLRLLLKVKIIWRLRTLVTSLPQMLPMWLQRGSVISTISDMSSSLAIFKIDLVHATWTQVPTYLRIIETFINTRLEIIIVIIDLIVLFSGYLRLLLLLELFILGLISFNRLASDIWSPVFISIISDHLLFIILIFNWKSLSLGRRYLTLILSLSPWLTCLQVTQRILLLSWIYSLWSRYGFFIHVLLWDCFHILRH